MLYALIKNITFSLGTIAMGNLPMRNDLLVIP